MSIQSDIVTALASLGSNKVWPQMVPQDVDPPFVVYRTRTKQPERTLDGTETADKVYIIFECYDEDYSGALALAGQVTTLLLPAASGLNSFEDDSPGEDYIPSIDGFVEPVFFGFWVNI